MHGIRAKATSPRSGFLVAVLLCLVGHAAPAIAEETPVARSVVKIFVTRRTPDLFRPWTKREPQESTGTGFVIDGNRLLTNAHVVQYASQIYVQANGSSKRLPAKLLAAASSVDLAVLTVDDEGFFSEHAALPLDAAMPREKTAVNVYGFPMGGDQISVTEGIISRIEYGSFFYDEQGLRIQIDAALNPGNSGGPALADGKVIGVAFSGFGKAERADNIGYLIAAEEVELFLKDLEDGKYDGKQKVWHDFQTTENDDLRAWLKLPDDVGGTLVTRCETKDSAVLRPGDVITRVGELAIDRDGYVRAGGRLPLPFTYHVERLARDGQVPLTIFREGASLEVSVPVTAHRARLIPFLAGRYPEYFVLGPLVFSTPAQELAQYTRDYPEWTLWMAMSGSPLMARMTDPPAFEGEELVYVPCPFLPHALTKGYGPPTMRVLTEVNGVAIRNLAHLVELVRDNQEEFLEFRFAGSAAETLVFRRQQLLDATEEILSDAGIRNQHSASLKEVWERPE